VAHSSSDDLRLYGTQSPSAPFRDLRAGPLQVRLENGNLRYVRYDGHEILRAVSYIVRDRDWGTYTPQIQSLEITESDTAFHVSYQGVCVEGPAQLHFSAVIEGNSEGRLSYSVEAVPQGDFETNRCGFTVLHPIDGVAGAPATVEHCDGSIEETRFPELIDPWQPFKSIRAIVHAPAPGLRARCLMEGDAYEMEDQRNWSDASFKTYIRPLELAWPYTMPNGEPNRQRITLSIEDAGSEDRESPPAPRFGIPVALGEITSLRLPRIGLVVTPDEIETAARHHKVLEDIGPQSILCHYDPTAGHGRAAIEGFAALQRVYPAAYDLECVVTGAGDLQDEFDRLADNVRACGLALASIAVCPSVDRQSTPPGSAWPQCPPLEDIYRAARKAFPAVTLGGGMFSYFTELNRKRPAFAMLDYVTHATNPIVHAADDESVMETLQALPHITRSVRAMIGADKAYRIGPSTIGMRQNPYGSRTMDNPNGERLCMAGDDPRQRGQFCAAWTAGYAARIAPAGIDVWTAAAFIGPRGVIDDSGLLLPVGRTLRDFARHAGARLIACDNSAANQVAALACETADGSVSVLLANLTAEPVTVTLNDEVALAPFEVRRIPATARP